MATAHIALVGDYDPSVTAHIAIPKALELALHAGGHDLDWHWVGTDKITSEADISGFDAVWCVPASPYSNTDGAFTAIRHVREQRKPFLGTCGGYQHAVLEFTQNVLGHAEAGNAEVDPDCAMSVVSPLTCALVEVEGSIRLDAGSKMAALHGALETSEGYHCSYGVNPDYLTLYEGTALRFTGFDSAGEPRAFELEGHPFFVGTAYQPERAALTGTSHTLVEEFVLAVAQRHAAAA